MDGNDDGGDRHGEMDPTDLHRGEGERDGGETEKLLKDRFRLSVISIAEAEAKKNQMEVSELVVACVADLTYKFSAPLTCFNPFPIGQLARDLELFARHANRKSINMQDVILSAHRNEQLVTTLRDLSQELKDKNPQSERKRKKASKREDDAI